MEYPYRVPMNPAFAVPSHFRSQVLSSPIRKVPSAIRQVPSPIRYQSSPIREMPFLVNDVSPGVCESLSIHGSGFVVFDAKAAPNMSYQEKISRWLDNIPWLQVDDNVWVLNCYSGIVSSSGSSVQSAHDHDHKIELQSQQITRLVTQQYLMEEEEDDEEMSRDVWYLSDRAYMSGALIMPNIK